MSQSMDFCSDDTSPDAACMEIDDGTKKTVLSFNNPTSTEIWTNNYYSFDFGTRTGQPPNYDEYWKRPDSSCENPGEFVDNEYGYMHPEYPNYPNYSNYSDHRGYSDYPDSEHSTVCHPIEQVSLGTEDESVSDITAMMRALYLDKHTLGLMEKHVRFTDRDDPILSRATNGNNIEQTEKNPKSNKFYHNGILTNYRSLEEMPMAIDSHDFPYPYDGPYN